MEIKEMNHDSVLATLPDREITAHKGDFGRILLLCGSKGYTGAAALAAMGALRCGAGLVYLGVPEAIYAIEAIKLSEPIVLPLPTKKGMLSARSIKTLKSMITRMDAVLIGPGLGRSNDVSRVVKWLLQNYNGPVVVDADGINAVCTHKNILRDRKYPTILTPHEGEFERLGGSLKAGRISGAVQLAIETGSVIVLKGHRTIITDGETLYCNPTGNPGMAVGGCGDVLAGMITALLGQKLSPIDASTCAVWLHGAAGDICQEEIGQYGMLPSDMLNVLPRLMK